jgi:hypothetical protein
MPTISFVAAASLAASTLWTANDPFVGKWRLDVSRSIIIDEVRVEVVGPNTYRFNFEGAPAETVVADGTDQPGLLGTTLSVKIEDPRTLTVVRKQSGSKIVSAVWKLSQDGRALRDRFTGLKPDGSKVAVDYLYKRMSGSSGFAGTWESSTKPVGLKVELGIRPYNSQGLSFVGPGSDKNVVFDGQSHAVPSKDGLTVSGRRPGTLTLEYTEKYSGKVERARRFELSLDGRSLKETVHAAGQAMPDVLIFERQ